MEGVISVNKKRAFDSRDLLNRIGVMCPIPHMP